MINKLIRFCLENKLVVILFTVGLILWGSAVAPFDWESDWLPRDPVPVDAIPDIGENQQIVFTEWTGRSPQDIEDQITYPLTTALLGLPQVKTVRSYSMFGFSSIYIIFKEDAEFYWTRSRILEKLNSLPSGTLPQGVSPQLRRDATALGQVFWYTLEGRSPEGEPTGGWDLDELRSTQDWYVRYALQGVEGVAEVASIGGFVKEYQVDVDPDALRTYDIALHEVFDAVRGSNFDVGARTIEINSVEYVIRGLGFIEDLDDLRKTVITQRNNVPITLEQVASVNFGPALRRGALDKAGGEAVGGVVVTRYGIKIKSVQDVIEVAVGGRPITQTVEGRERYPVRVRYMRELRDTIEAIENILVAAPDGTQIPLRELASVNYVRGPQVIKSENTFLVGYVIFDKRDGYAEVEVIEQAQQFLQETIDRGELDIPEGVSYQFTGSYENQVRAEKRLRVVLPFALFAIWLILYFQFKRVSETLMVFSGIAFAWAGGFILLWLYAQPWFLDVNLFGQNLRDLFQMGTVNLSVAVWVGFLALFGIATDNGVIVCTYLQQVFRERKPVSIESIRAATVEAGQRRVRPAMMTSATTILALLPVLTSTGRGSNIMVPMAIPSFGGMLLAILTIFVVPVLYCGWAEVRYRFQNQTK